MELFAKMDVKAIQDGLIMKVGGVKHFSVLAAIASFANSKGEAFPSQDKLAEMVGYSRKTVNQYIGELRETKIDGEPILVVVQEKTPKGRRNKYVLSPKSGFWFGIVTKSSDNVTESGNGVVTKGLQEQEPLLTKTNIEQENNIIFDNAKAVLQYFRQQYFNKYHVAYQPNWGRDQAMIKNKLLSNFTDNEIKSIIDVVFKEYDNRWAKPQFPRPTIGQLCSWLPNEALAIAQKQTEENKRIEAESKKYEMNDDHFERLLKEFE
ncbi:helix-turn-helix domain-containing protein [Terrihalobacillus insolitus]|uniref:helix-turn-helix domain-containing protein n=1 Tax=Terrihalobacillus insolitus TaxID=2950438 RepID=UPI0023407FB5|nr:helix-turn-helix domain-containing protein [Terrihalobacillus insolitus]MDC3413948.1 helix-turn-helix domain-containing protein [Terrihalobacillus insolitus]